MYNGGRRSSGVLDKVRQHIRKQEAGDGNDYDRSTDKVAMTTKANQH